MDTDNSFKIYERIEQQHTRITTLIYNIGLVVLVYGFISALMMCLSYAIFNYPNMRDLHFLFDIQ